MEQKISAGRIQWMDRARALAILLVILTHSVEALYGEYTITWIPMSLGSNLLRMTLMGLGRLGVPLFLCLTGALILSKKFETADDLKYFYRHNVFRLFLLIEVWNLIYNFILAGTRDNFDPLSFLRCFFFLEIPDMPNMWYMPMILGLYLGLPFVAMAVQRFSARDLALPFGAVLFACSIIPTLNAFLGFHGSYKLDVLADLSLLGGLYTLYIVAGYYIAKGSLKNLGTGTVWILALGGFVFAYLTQTYTLEREYEWFFLWYNNLGVVLCGLSLFELFRRSPTRTVPAGLEKSSYNLSRWSLGLYFLHILFVKFLTPLLAATSIRRIFLWLILWVAATAGSVLITALLQKVPWVNQYVLGIKKS